MKITKLETFLVKPRWLFLKIHTDEGLVGFLAQEHTTLGESYLKNPFVFQDGFVDYRLVLV